MRENLQITYLVVSIKIQNLKNNRSLLLLIIAHAFERLSLHPGQSTKKKLIVLFPD